MKSSLPSHPIDEEHFEDVFLQELDSWFTADIACCDHCFEGFLEKWPMAYAAEDYEFQTNQIQLDCFYDGSRIGYFYTKEQFKRLVQNLDCPRCGEKLGYTLYPYNFPFDVPDGFEAHVEVISALAVETPFLILTSEFAVEILETIRLLANETPARKLETSMFRARGMAGLKDLNVGQFNFPPPEVVSEGRYNHAGAPVLYFADSKETCFHELRGTVCAVAEVAIAPEIKILDLVAAHESHGSDSELLNALVFSSLLSTPSDSTGYRKPEYVFSRFVADCARSSGFDGIRYPSTRTAEGSHNLVVWNRDLSLGQGSQIQKMSVFDGEKSRSIAP
ncbi:RES family NAD+ phosphorylase [Phaeobacter inhibens]|uniref:RES family NAD+ phosphorylase n=1 Tax=Phaeobacter inhibens TaxID=221822 RepID=UPI0024918FE8|nr:RES family NAD+ phosphorylase [Phaeobacter inhibens]